MQFLSFLQIDEDCSSIENPNKDLVAYSKSGNLTGVKFILRHCNGTDVNTLKFYVEGAPRRWFFTPLIWASYYGHREVVQLLLDEKEIEINKPDKMGRTALIHASINGHSDVVIILVENKGIDLNKADTRGYRANRTALFLATYKGYSEIARLILQKDGVDINHPNYLGQTALFWASMNGLSAVVKMLVNRPEVDINRIYTFEGKMTALWTAFMWKHRESVQHILEHPSSNVTLGARSENASVADLIFDIGTFDLWDLTVNQNLLVYSLMGNASYVTALLQSYGSDVNTNDSFHRTPLFWAATRGHTAVVRLLLGNASVLVNTERNINGATALFQASKYGHREIVDLLTDQSSQRSRSFWSIPASS